MTDAERGQVATSAAEVYEDFFLPALFGQWPETVLDRAFVGEGDRVLDVGCGTGVLARSALELVGATGSVTGLDPNEGMLSVARRSPSITWQEGVAERLPFDDGAFDRAVSQFAMMFFNDARIAIREIKRVLRPGGTVAVATWASLDQTPGYAAMVEILDDMFGAEAAAALKAPYSLGDPAQLESLLEPHFASVTAIGHPGVAQFDSIDSWIHTDIRGWTLSDMSDEDYQELLNRARLDLAQFCDEDGAVSFAAPALIVSGTR